MKRLWLSLGLTLLLLTGCTSDALGDYQKASVETGKVSRGNLKIDLNLKTKFMTEGLTMAEMNDLSYFDEIEFSMNVLYDSSKEPKRAIAWNYYNFGGMGLDSVFYMNGQEMYMKIPIADGYVNLKDQAGEAQNLELFPEEGFNKVFEPIKEKWNEVLNQEDVFKGKKTYILTDKGQIKTTTYSIEASEEQLKAIGDTLIKTVEDQNLIEKLATEIGSDTNVDRAFYLEQMQSYMNKIVLVGFKGDAYVDFDGRLVKEAYTISLGLKDPKKGEPSTMDIAFVVEHLSLGEEQIFEFPIVQEDEWLDISNGIDTEGLLPENIFN